MRRFEFVDGKSNKFWEVDVKGKTLNVIFGKIGTKRQSKPKDFATPEKANTEMEKLIKEKTGKGYVEVGGEAAKAIKPAAKLPSSKKANPGSMGEGLSKAEKQAKAKKVLLMFAGNQWELAHNILENSQDEEWLFEQLLNGCKIEKGKPIPSKAIKKVFKKDEKSSPVLAMLNIMLCNPSSSKALKSFKFEKLKGDLILDRLTSLSDGAAEALSKYKGKLYFSYLESLSDAGAEALSRHEGDLNLRGLKSLSDAAAESLSKHKGELDLSYLESLSDAAAEALSKHEGELNLGGLTSLSDSPGHVALAKKLVYKNTYLYLRGLTSLSDAAAEALSRHDWRYLYLSGLRHLSDEAAESLSKHDGDLDLSGLKSLSDAGAETLSKHKGDLYLRGLESLSDTAAEALSKCKGDLYLSGLTSLSDAGAEAFSKHEGKLELSRLRLTHLSDAGAEALSKNKRYRNIEDYDLDP